jgi:hypothetical protein
MSRHGNDAHECTDVWFRSHQALEELAAALGARVRSADVEDYWQWVIADFADIQINITRAHTKAPNDTDTRIFQHGSGPSPGLPQHALQRLVVELQRIGIRPIYVGKWVYRHGNDFDHVVHEEIAAQVTTGE